MARRNTQQLVPLQKQSLLVAFLAASVLWTRGAVAQAPNPFLLQWGHDGVNNLSPPTSAVSTIIGPFAPGTPLSITVTTLNNVGPGNEYFSKVRLIWSGRQEDFMASTTMEYGLACLPFTGTSGNSEVVWDFAAATTAPFTAAGLEIAFFFQMNGVIGNVQASNLILTVELTDNLFAVTQKSFLVQIAQPAPTPSPTLPAPTPTPTPTVTATPTPTPTVMPATGSTAPTPTPTQTQAPTNTPTPTPTQTVAPTNTPTPTPTQTQGLTNTPTPTPTQTQGPTNTPTPTPSQTTSPQSTTPAPTAATCPYQPAASAGNPCFSADGHTSWFCADPSPQCAQTAVNKCLPTQGYPFHNAAGQTC